MSNSSSDHKQKVEIPMILLSSSLNCSEIHLPRWKKGGRKLERVRCNVFSLSSPGWDESEFRQWMLCCSWHSHHGRWVSHLLQVFKQCMGGCINLLDVILTPPSPFIAMVTDREMEGDSEGDRLESVGCLPCSKDRREFKTTPSFFAQTEKTYKKIL